MQHCAFVVTVERFREVQARLRSWLHGPTAAKCGAVGRARAVVSHPQRSTATLWLRSKIEPTLTVKLRRHGVHQYQSGPIALPPNGFTRSNGSRDPCPR